MIHPSRKGVYCDLCGNEVLISNDKITYFTINMKRIISHKDMANDIEDVLDLDFCGDCHSRMHDRVLKVSEINNKKREEYARKHPRSNQG